MLEAENKRFEKTTAGLDAVATAVAFGAAHALWTRVAAPEEIPLIPHVALVLPIIALWGVLLFFFGAYRSPRTTELFDYGLAILKAVGAGLGVLLAALFFLKLHFVSRAVVLIFVLLDLWALGMVRFVTVTRFRRSLHSGRQQVRVLVIGTGSRARRLTEAVRSSVDLGVHVVGYLDPDPAVVGQPLFLAPVIGTVADIHRVLKDNVIDEVIIAIPHTLLPQMSRIADACEEEGVRLGALVDVLDMRAARMRFSVVGGLPLLTLEPVAQEEGKLVVKRLMDLALTLAFLPVLLPLVAVIALAIKLDSPGPVFFVQRRVGLNKRLFPMIKFRTMVQDAEKLMAEVEHLNEAEGPIFKIANDPRVTRVGRLLRRTSLDEFPQFFNVLRGEMSLVGPRPMSIRDVDRFDQGIQRKRFSVKPGITCLWQISGRSNLPFTAWLELDLRYIDEWSLGLDLKILMRTIPVVLLRTGAV
jgi:exopolysaccharide biosynthesis polyprenyl glycosylphosphotransferase